MNMQKIENAGRKIDEEVRRFAERCETFGKHLERIGKEGLVKADKWEKRMQAKIDEWLAQDRKHEETGKS